MRKRTKFFIAYLVVLLLIYGIAAFVTLVVNPLAWNYDTRCATCGFAVAGIILAAFVVNLEPKDI